MGRVLAAVQLELVTRIIIRLDVVASEARKSNPATGGATAITFAWVVGLSANAGGCWHGHGGARCGRRFQSGAGAGPCRCNWAWVDRCRRLAWWPGRWVLGLAVTVGAPTPCTV